MSEWVRAALDIILILMVGSGLVQAARLIRHLAGLRQGRVEMERFVRDFSATVLRAENGIKGLRQAARESGDDLEKLVEKAVAMRDELNFIVESADQLAERLSHSARDVMRAEARTSGTAADTDAAAAAEKPKDGSLASFATRKVEPSAAAPTATPASRAEKDLLQALQKLS